MTETGVIASTGWENDKRVKVSNGCSHHEALTCQCVLRGARWLRSPRNRNSTLE